MAGINANPKETKLLISLKYFFTYNPFLIDTYLGRLYQIFKEVKRLPNCKKEKVIVIVKIEYFLEE